MMIYVEAPKQWHSVPELHKNYERLWENVESSRKRIVSWFWDKIILSNYCSRDEEWTFSLKDWRWLAVTFGPPSVTFHLCKPQADLFGCCYIYSQFVCLFERRGMFSYPKQQPNGLNPHEKKKSPSTSQQQTATNTTFPSNYIMPASLF